MTARWLVDEVAPHRDLHITWQPISLLFKNEPAEDSRWYQPNLFTHKLLRVMEAARAGGGEDAVFPLYWEYARRIHHERQDTFDPSAALEAVGLDRGLVTAFDDPSWDDEIRRRMGVGLDLAGTDIGTPIIAMDDAAGDRTAIFGPVITRVPPTAESLAIWDSVVTLTTSAGFWELKRARTEPPEFPASPQITPFSGQ